MAGRELPQVRQRELRDRQHLRLRRRHRGEYQDHRQPGPQDREHPGPPRGNELAAAERALAALLADPATTAAAKNAAIPAAERAISAARRNLREAAAARDGIPAKLPADQIDPDARTAVLRTGRRGLQMVLRLLAHNAEHWLATHLNAYLRDDDEYRAATRATIIRGLAGTITFTPAAITVTLQAPAEPRLARALALLTDEINTQPPAIPGDSRPITYRIHPQPRI